MPEAIDLFTPVVDEKQLHPNFINTLGPRAFEVRKVLEEWAGGFVDRDGKFVKEFQTTYNSGFWELYLFAVLKHLKLQVDFSYPLPDFVCREKNLILEATIASHAHDDVPEWEKTISGITDENIGEIWRQSTIRLSNAFTSKVKKFQDDYCKLDHVKGRPFLIGISNYSRQDFNLQGDVPMQWLLYDVLKLSSIRKSSGSQIPLGLFLSDEFSDISGVLYSSVATFGKARALGNDDDSFIFHAMRIKDNFTPIRIEAKKSEYRESLCDGLRLFTNPHARNPINMADFNDMSIRTFIADKNGDYCVSCHEDGDLCMRTVEHRQRRR